MELVNELGLPYVVLESIMGRKFCRLPVSPACMADAGGFSEVTIQNLPRMALNCCWALPVHILSSRHWMDVDRPTSAAQLHQRWVRRVAFGKRECMEHWRAWGHPGTANVSFNIYSRGYLFNTRGLKTGKMFYIFSSKEGKNSFQER